jgi:hypothetical protein
MPRSLITWAEINATHQGTFSMPYDLAYSQGHTAQLGDGNIVVGGAGYSIADTATKRIGVLSLPGTLDGSLATVLATYTDPTNDLLPAGWLGADDYQLGGLLEIAGRLYFAKNQYYNATGTDWASIGYNTSYVGGSANAVGMWGLTGTGVHSQRVGGYLGYAPEAVITDGYSFTAGLQGSSGAANSRFGPNLFAVQVDDGETAPGIWLSKPLLYHDTEAHESPGWWIGSISSGIWIETENRHGVLFLVAHEVGGITWYGTVGDEVPGYTDPYDNVTQAYHSAGYGVSAWLYDPADLMEVYNGTKNGWECVPYEVTPLITLSPGDDAGDEVYTSVIPGKAFQEFRLSIRDGRLIVVRPGGYSPGGFSAPSGHVFDLNSIADTPPVLADTSYWAFASF